MFRAAHSARSPSVRNEVADLVLVRAAGGLPSPERLSAMFPTWLVVSRRRERGERPRSSSPWRCGFAPLRAVDGGGSAWGRGELRAVAARRYAMRGSGSGGMHPCCVGVLLVWFAPLAC